MKRKSLIILLFTILFVSIAFSVFAMDNVTGNIRNFVGGTENMVENAGNGIMTGIKDGINTVSNGSKNVVEDVKNGANDAKNTVTGTVTNNNSNNNRYTATRTSADDVTVAGMTGNTWSWIIVAITAAAIILLIWSYFRQKSSNDIYIDSDDE